MKKNEITNLVTQYLSKNNIHFMDMLGKTITINSYDEFLSQFTLIKSTYKDRITEFFDVAESYLSKMDSLVSECQETNDVVEVKIDLNIRNKLTIYGSSAKRIDVVFVQSLNASGECSEAALTQIYQELGYEKLKKYIELIKTPNHLGNYLSASDKQDVAMHYILYKTNHHSNARLRRNNSAAQLYNVMNQNIKKSINEIVSAKDDYITFMNQEKESFSVWFKENDKNIKDFCEQTKTSFTDFMNDSEKRINQLEVTYSEKLKIEEPADFMLKKAKEYGKKTKRWALITVVLSCILLWLLAKILSPEISFAKRVITIHLFNSDMPVYSSIIIFAMIALVIYVIKIFIKMTISSKHLSEEYHQKYVLTYFYLSLVNANKMSKEQGDIILSVLFSKADTGLLKNENSNEWESIYKLLTHK